MAISKDSAEALARYILAAEYYKLRMDLPSQPLRRDDGSRTPGILRPLTIGGWVGELCLG